METRAAARVMAGVAALTLLAACGGTSTTTQTAASASPTPTTSSPPTPRATHKVRPKPKPLHSSTPEASPKPTKKRRSSPAPVPVPVTKLLVFVVENHSLAQMRTDMPRTFALAQRFGYASDYHAITHPSLPNYLVMTSGSLQGVHDDRPPAQHPVHSHSIFGRALASGHTAAAYADSMGSPCQQADKGSYLVRHNPWTYFVAEHGQCQQHDRPMSRFAGDVAAGRLPDAGFVAPDRCHDAHDCSLGVADAWFAQAMSTVMNGPDWLSGRLAVVLTADEDDRHSGNVVLTAVLSPSQDHHVVTTPLNHYSLYGLYEDVLGLPHDEDHRTTSMATAFGLPLG